ncbi:MAG TPA: hypothetical protein VMZ28_03650 [Kofleriaceae bacterium]|nr:hypothetical protein [Kofleriaceae bacterium]
MALVACVVAVSGCVGCASPNQPKPGDMSSSSAICPNHPEQCGGQCCGDVCVDTGIDPRNCGACGKACTVGEVCSGNKCGCLPSGAPCGAGQSCCNANGCKSLNADINNCGGCGITCGPGGTCSNGECKCGGVTCPAGQSCCGGSCKATCANDMGVPLDMTSTSGLCQCSNHCANALFVPWCVGPDCCYEDSEIISSGGCLVSSACQVNMNP